MRKRELSVEREREGRPPRIFVSYRREDTGGHAGRLYDALAARFGPENVFMDIDTIDLGVDFTEAINRAVTSYDVVIALIGRGWLEATDAEGRRRLDNPVDFLRLELEAALSRDVFVIPTCVQGAQIPHADRLPPSLVALPSRQGIELRDVAWGGDVERLIRRINRLGGDEVQREVSPPAREPRRLWHSKRVQVAVVLVLVALAGLAAAIVLAFDGADGNGEATPDERLLGSVPAVVRSSCIPISYGEETALASIECGGVGITADYHRFASAAAMNAWYTQQREAAGISPGAGECTAATFHGEKPYEAGGEQVGSYLCFVPDDEPQLVSIDRRGNVGLEAFRWEGTGQEAVRSLLRQWRCCLRTQPDGG